MCTVSCSNFVFIFCSDAILAITFLKEVAKTKFAKISNKAKVKELAASNRISTTNVRVEIYKPRLLKLCAYNNRVHLASCNDELYESRYNLFSAFL